MSQDTQDTTLQALFEDAHQELSDDAFTADVMQQTGRLKRRRWLARASAGLVLALVVVFLQDMALVLTQTPLMDLGESWMANVAAPLNSVGSMLSLGLVGLRMAYKKLFAFID